MHTASSVLAAALLTACAGAAPAQASDLAASTPASPASTTAPHRAGLLILPTPAATSWSQAFGTSDATTGAEPPVHLAAQSAVPAETMPALPSPGGGGLPTMVPRLGAFNLTFYSTVPASGFDGMTNADVVISLTRRF